MFKYHRVVLRLGGCSLAFKVWGKISEKCLKGNRIYRDKFNYGGKLHDFNVIFLGEVAFIWLQRYNNKTSCNKLESIKFSCKFHNN